MPSDDKFMHCTKFLFLFSTASAQIDRIEDHIYYCCPECSYKTDKEETFKTHALEKHPESLVLFVKNSDDDSKIGKFFTF